jgi:hypothetical protein
MPGARDVPDLSNPRILKYQACDVMFFTSLMLCGQCVRTGLDFGLRAAGSRAKKSPAKPGEAE